MTPLFAEADCDDAGIVSACLRKAALRWNMASSRSGLMAIPRRENHRLHAQAVEVSFKPGQSRMSINMYILLRKYILWECVPNGLAFAVERHGLWPVIVRYATITHEIR